ncbi:MAG: hypothetical protein SVV03_03070, partial [Candidatus Nanohaloarchaea archaeon]|nr:hypothetical protein [Candidatus Nanohaloarchaea archaeon]
IEFHNFEFMEGLSVWTQHESYKEAREFVSKVSGKEIEQSQEPDIYQNPRALLSIINDVAQRKTTFEIALESDPLRAEIIGKALDKGIPEDMLSRIKREFSGFLRRAQELGYGQDN